MVLPSAMGVYKKRRETGRIIIMNSGTPEYFYQCCQQLKRAGDMLCVETLVKTV